MEKKQTKQVVSDVPFMGFPYKIFNPLFRKLRITDKSQPTLVIPLKIKKKVPRKRDVAERVKLFMLAQHIAY